jgi:hypothetical protein
MPYIQPSPPYIIDVRITSAKLHLGTLTEFISILSLLPRLDNALHHTHSHIYEKARCPVKVVTVHHLVHVLLILYPLNVAPSGCQRALTGSTSG